MRIKSNHSPCSRSINLRARRKAEDGWGIERIFLHLMTRGTDVLLVHCRSPSYFTPENKVFPLIGTESLDILLLRMHFLPPQLFSLLYWHLSLWVVPIDPRGGAGRRKRKSSSDGIVSRIVFLPLVIACSSSASTEPRSVDRVEVVKGRERVEFQTNPIT